PLVLVATGSSLTAAGTNIAISAAAAATGAWRHLREGRVDARVVAWMAPPSLAGAVAGALVAHRIPREARYAGVAAVLARDAFDPAVRPVRPRTGERLRLAPTIPFGFAIGVLGGAVGVILGTLRTPVLLRAVGMDIRRAAGTNLTVGFVLGVAGFVTHAARL